VACPGDLLERRHKICSINAQYKRMQPFLRNALFISFLSISSLIAGCKKDPRPPATQAEGSLVSSEYGECLPSKPHGTFYNGYDVNTDSNYAEISVYVTKPGAYKIATGQVDGVSFTGSGAFSDTGLNTVRMKGTGRFTSSGQKLFPLTFDSTHCSLYLTVSDSAGLSIADNTWEFTAEGHTYRGTFTMAFYDIPVIHDVSFEFQGRTSGDSSLSMGYEATSAYGTHTTTEPLGGWGLARPDYKFIYHADNSTAPAAVITINFLSVATVLDPFRTTVIGSFDGTALDSAGKVVQITHSKFKSVQ